VLTSPDPKKKASWFDAPEGGRNSRKPKLNGGIGHRLIHANPLLKNVECPCSLAAESDCVSERRRDLSNGWLISMREFQVPHGDTGLPQAYVEHVAQVV
jgi:hypothetical protein